MIQFHEGHAGNFQECSDYLIFSKLKLASGKT